MSVFSSPAFAGHEQVSFGHDLGSGLRAIIAVHDSTLGPAVGGCRMYPYTSDAEALNDVLRLSRGMTYKSALAGLPLGGGKSVIIGDPRRDKSRELLLAMGRFIDAQAGRYVAAEDSGTSPADLRIMSERTPWISGVEDNGAGGDPSPSTALGVFLGMRAAIRHRLGSDAFDGMRVAIQGMGNVGYHLARLLGEAGAVVYGADVSEDNLRRAELELGVIPVEAGSVLGMEVDILAPCAMGAVFNEQSIPGLRAGIICGAANNQLARPDDGAHLRDAGILYCPDFLVNAGGIIDVHYQRENIGVESRRTHIARIESTLAEVLRRADAQSQPSDLVAESLAEEYLRGVSGEAAVAEELARVG